MDRGRMGWIRRNIYHFVFNSYVRLMVTTSTLWKEIWCSANNVEEYFIWQQP